jgi:hypothetical protein
MTTVFEYLRSVDISGHAIHLSERHVVAVYRRNGVSWVAEFRDGAGELSDPASWFRSMLGTLRYSHGARRSALDSMTVLTPELIFNIEALHSLATARDTRAASVPAWIAAALRCASDSWARAIPGEQLHGHALEGAAREERIWAAILAAPQWLATLTSSIKPGARQHTVSRGERI